MQNFFSVLSFVHDHALWLVLLYYIAFLIQVWLKKRDLKSALLIPTVTVFMGLLVAAISMMMANDCHPAHGIPCENRELNFDWYLYTFKALIVVVQIVGLPILYYSFKKKP